MGVESDAVPALGTEVLSGRYTAILHVGNIVYNTQDEDGKVNDKLMKYNPLIFSVFYVFLFLNEFSNGIQTPAANVFPNSWRNF